MTYITEKLAKIKEKPETLKFKQDLLDFLNITNSSKEITYHIIKDLSIMISMPFYKEANIGLKNRMSVNEIIKNYCKISIEYIKITGNIDFIKILFKWLSLNQGQSLRKLSKLNSKQKSVKRNYYAKGITGVFEHPIPIRYTKELLLNYIISNNYEDCSGYIDFVYKNTTQIFLRSDLNKKVVNCYNDTMPKGWNWKENNNNNPYQRYIEVGIFGDIVF